MDKTERLLKKGSYFLTRGRDFVEIGGKKWATCNIGADKPTDYGLYFSWGSAKGNTIEEIENNEGTLIENMAFNDAAYENWGGRWRVPSDEDFRTLIHHPDVLNQFIEDYNNSGVAGLLFYDGHNKLFFPAVGHCYINRRFSINEGGYYWTRNSSANGRSGIDLSFISYDTVGVYSDTKSLCFAIRPILDI